MKFEDIPECERFEYIKSCECGKEYTLFAQEDDLPEYHTIVYLKCGCGEYIEFNLPVN